MDKNEVKKYEFQLLSDEIADSDFFEDKTHEKVADTLYQLIDNNEYGFTIGLEGSWGSGKSTVISILKKKIESEPFLYFYFDAWAHEGDHLRRIFLEALISQLDTGSDFFKELKQEISNRKRKTCTRTRQYGTDLGKLLALSVLFVPLGAAIVSGIDGLQLSFKLGGEPSVLFWLGAALSVMPFLVIIFNIFNLLFRKKIALKNVLDKQYWAFLESDSTNTIIQEVSEEEERSSIEFERYFGDIISEIFKHHPSSKLLIVVDNLDRIDANDSLKIWSTLQTFLQQRNPSNSSHQWYKKIWIIVPYDMTGLSKLWENEKESTTYIPNKCSSTDTTSKELDSEDNGSINSSSYDDSLEFSLGSCAKSFFDKCFQIRIEVPEPVLTGWEQFTREMMDIALIGWDSEDKNTILRVLKLTRENLGDTPTPREIKNYINQIGIIRLHNLEGISTESIAYYTVYRYLKGISTSSLKRSLIINSLPRPKDTPFLPPDCNKHLAGIVFGVSPEKGQQLLLEPEIETALKEAKYEDIKSLAQIHGGAFWSVFDYHVNNLTTSTSLFNYSYAVYDGLWDDYSTNCSKFLTQIKEIFTTNPPYVPANGRIGAYLPIIKMISNAEFHTVIWDHVVKNLSLLIDRDAPFNNDQGVKDLQEIVGNLCINPSPRKISPSHEDKVYEDKLIGWAQAAISLQIPAYSWVSPSEESVKTIISKNIGPSSPIVPGTRELFIYSIKAGINNWKELPSLCKNHIFQSNGNRISENNPSLEILDILVWLTSHDDITRSEIKDILETGQFHNYVYHQQNDKATIYSALLMAYYFKSELHNIKVGLVANSESGLQLMQKVWLNRDKVIAEKMLMYLKEFNLLPVIWDLVENKDNKLLIDIITLALDEENDDLFSCSDALNKIHFIMDLLEDEGTNIEDILVGQFIKYSTIENEIINSSDLDISKYSHDLLLIIRITNNEDVVSKIESAFMVLRKSEWDFYFAEDTYLANLALELKDRKPTFGLENAYYDSILEFAEQWVNDEVEVTDWQKENWSKLVALMGTSFQKNYGKKISKLVLDLDFAISIEFFEHNVDFFESNVLFKEGVTKIQDSFEEALKDNGDFDRLKVLDMILSNDKNEIFIPERHFSDVVSRPFVDIYNLQDLQENQEEIEIIERLAHKFNITLMREDMESDDGAF